MPSACFGLYCDDVACLVQAALRRRGLAVTSIALQAAAPVMPVAAEAPPATLPLAAVLGILAAAALVLGALACVTYMVVAARCARQRVRPQEHLSAAAPPAAVAPFFANYPAFASTYPRRLKEDLQHATAQARPKPGLD